MNVDNAVATAAPEVKSEAVELSVVERIEKAGCLFEQSKTTKSGVKTANKIFCSKIKNVNPEHCPESRKGHLFPTESELFCSTYDKAIQKVAEMLTKKGYAIKFLAGIKIERRVNHTAPETLQIRTVSPAQNETTISFNEKCGQDVRLLSLLELLYFVLIEEVVSTKEMWVICSGDMDFGFQSKDEHVPLVKIDGKNITILPTRADQVYKYPFGVLVEVYK